ncbi:hypothetical protein HDU82_001265 [Entophlyctis luteolus]|nr:hypothetical protein HDU82_001265 [Entophlyctis luteolus]
MFEITLASTTEHVAQVKSLQNENLRRLLPVEVQQTDGFVTAEYTVEFLTQMNHNSPAVIALDEDGVVAGYILGCTREDALQHPLMKTLVNQFDSLNFHNYVLVGQLCVAKRARGHSLAVRMYELFAKEYKRRGFSCSLTSVAQDNAVSLNVHKKAGWNTVHSYEYDGVLNAFFGVSIFIALGLTGVCVNLYVRVYSSVSLFLLVSSLLYIPKIVGATIYFNVYWLNVKVRYFLVYFNLNFPYLILFFVYEWRLNGLAKAAYGDASSLVVRVVVYILLSCLGGLYMAQVVVFVALAQFNSVGGYTSTGPANAPLSIAVYAMDNIVSACICIISTFATLKLYRDVETLRIGQSNTSSWGAKLLTIMTADAAKLFAVLMIDTFKSCNMVEIGVLDKGNLGFQHFIDTMKLSFLIFALLVPSAVEKMVSSKQPRSVTNDSRKKSKPGLASSDTHKKELNEKEKTFSVLE